MPRVSIVQTNFTAGEFSPRLAGRTDIDRYNNAARKLLNAHPVIHGGAKRRAGTRFFKATKLAGKVSRLIPFVFNRDTAYMLEVGDTYVRVHGAGGVDLGVEFATSYTESMLPDIDYAQGADTMFLAHPTVPMQRLRRFSASSFNLSAVPFTQEPVDEQGHKPATTLTLSATSGTGVTATAGASAFLASDVGRAIVSGAGVAMVKAVASATSATVDVVTTFASVSLASGAWALDSSPMALVKPILNTGPVGAVVELDGGLSRAASIQLSSPNSSSPITINASAGVFAAGDVGKFICADVGRCEVTGFTDSQHLTAKITEDFVSVDFVEGAWGITDDVWRSEDVGKLIAIDGGLLKIASVTSASIARCTVVQALESKITAPAQGWQLKSTVWNASSGYPRTVTLHEQRLLAASTVQNPQTVWGSRTAEYLDFTTGTADTDAYSFTIAADEVNPISYLATLRNLVVHTFGGEFSIQGGLEKPVTPTNVRVRPETNHGSKGVRPVTVGDESVFVQRAGRKVRALGYSAGDERYLGPDLTVMAEHITESGVAGLAYQQEPDLILWGWREDGAFLSCTLDREQSVVGWAQHTTEGWVESMATIPNGDREETWLIVRRIVNGATVRYLEIMDDAWEPLLPGAAYTGFPPAPPSVVYGYTVDAGMAFDNALGQDTFSVPHLAGCTVDIVADGSVMSQQVVPVSGSITIPRKALRTLIGLHFESEVGLLTPEVGTGTGTAQGNSMRTSEITMRFLNTLGAKVLDGDGGEQDVPFRRFGPAVLNQVPAPFSGSVRIETLGWERGRSELTVVQDQPLPMHLLSVVRKFTVND